MLRLMQQYYPLRNIVFYLLEGLIIFGVFLVSSLLLTEKLSYINIFLCFRILLITLICQTCLYYNDMYDFKVASTLTEVSIRLLQSLGVTSIALAVIYLLFPLVIVNQFVFIISIAFLIFFIIGWRFLYILVIKRGLFNQKIIILGDSPLAFDIVNEIKTEPDCGYEIHAMVVNGAQNTENDNPVDKINLLAQEQQLCSLIKEAGVSKVVVALKEQRGLFPTDELIKCRTTGIEILEGSSFYETLTGKVLVTKIKPSWLIYSEGFRKSRLRTLVKRLEDIIVSSIMLTLLSPLLILVGVLIKMDSKGPVFFSQDRVGQNGKEYMMHKFRSMVADAEKKTGPVWAQENDDRITRVGRVIRKYRIDELPQLWDVLTGKMSMVGPRPERKHFTDELEQKIPFYSERFIVKPGLTGWAQVSYDYGATVDDAIEKLNYDLFYIKNLSITMDVVIILRTVKTVLFGRGAR